MSRKLLPIATLLMDKAPPTVDLSGGFSKTVQRQKKRIFVFNVKKVSKIRRCFANLQILFDFVQPIGKKITKICAILQGCFSLW